MSANIPAEISKTLQGEINTVLVNGSYLHTQINISGRDAGVVKVTARSSLANNDEDDFIDKEFEHVIDGSVDLGAEQIQRTFTIKDKMLSALRFEDDGEGEFTVFIRSYGRVNN